MSAVTRFVFYKDIASVVEHHSVCLTWPNTFSPLRSFLSCLCSPDSFSNSSKQCYYDYQHHKYGTVSTDQRSTITNRFSSVSVISRRAVRVCCCCIVVIRYFDSIVLNAHSVRESLARTFLVFLPFGISVALL